MNITNLINFLINNPCQDPNILKVILFIRKIMEVAFIVVPIVLIILITIDFIKTFMANSEDTMKKSQKIVIKRLLYAVMLFFVMPIVNIVFSAFDGSGNIDKYSEEFDSENVNYLTCWTNAKSLETINGFEVKVKFDGNGGNVYGEDIKTCGGKVNCEITSLPRAEKKGEDFTGWSLNKECNPLIEESKITIVNSDPEYDHKEKDYYDMILYACWGEKKDNASSQSGQSSGNIENNTSSTEAPNKDLINHTLNNSDYYVLPNSISLATYARKNKYYQNANDSYRDHCLGFSMLYANAIKIKDNSIVNKSSLSAGNSPKLKNISFKKSENNEKSTILQEVYKELNKLNPVIVHINGDKEGTSRHYSVIIGYKKTANSNSLKESDFMLLDVAEANVEQMNGKGNWNGSELDNMNSRFMITGKDTGRDYGYRLYVVK